MEIGTEIVLLCAIARYRPMGPAKHFLMMNLLHFCAKKPIANISCTQIWEFLYSLYDISMIDQKSKLDEDELEPIDFTLPEEYETLMMDRRHNPESPPASECRECTTEIANSITEYDITMDEPSIMKKKRGRQPKPKPSLSPNTIIADEVDLKNENDIVKEENEESFITKGRPSIGRRSTRQSLINYEDPKSASESSPANSKVGDFSKPKAVKRRKLY